MISIDWVLKVGCSWQRSLSVNVILHAHLQDEHHCCPEDTCSNATVEGSVQARANGQRTCPGFLELERAIHPMCRKAQPRHDICLTQLLA